MRLLCPLCGWAFWLCDCHHQPFVEKMTSGGLRARALGWHEEPLAGLVHRFKYQEETFLADWFAAWLSRTLLSFSDRFELVPVPLHEKKLAHRGYNQSALIARGLARRTRMPIVLDGVWRVRETESQAQLSAEARAQNLRQAFRVSRAMDGKKLVILDDVVTTGSTSDALAAALAAKGGTVLGVISITMARPKER